MTIKVGDKLPDGKLSESTEFDEAAGCPMPPKDVSVSDALKGKKVVIFALPGAYTPTCSAKHVPSYVKNYDKLKAKKVDEIWCVATNDAFVMAAWGRDQKATAAANGPRSSASRSTSPRATWACARSAIRCWSRTAW